MSTRPLTTDHRPRTTDDGQRTTDDGQLDNHRYALNRGPGLWELTFEGRHATFEQEQGALYVAWLLLHPPPKPIHALVLALDARILSGQAPGAAEVIQQRYLGLDEAEAVRNMRRQERELEAVLDDKREIEPVRAEALRELEAIAEYQREHPWRSRECVQKCAQFVSSAIRRLYARLAGAVDGEGKPDPVLQAFARHLNERLLAASDGGGIPGRFRVGAALPGWFTYKPPPGVVWDGWGIGRLRTTGPRTTDFMEKTACDPSDRVCGPIQGEMRAKSKVQRRACGVQSPRSKVQSPEPAKSQVSSLRSKGRSPRGRRLAAVGYLARFLCAGLALALLVTGCAGPRPLKGGKAVTTHKPAGIIEQTLVQGENPLQATKQTQETVKVRTYTVPTGSRVEQSQPPAAVPAQLSTINSQPINFPRSTLNSQPSTSFLLAAPMPVVEREETRAGTELGAAQKDTARELGAKLSSLKGIVWVGVGLFVFGLASLVYPPLKVIIGSVTTSAALMLGGVSLMVLPSLIVGNELLILSAVAVAVGAWFLAHRHGQLRGIVAATAADQTKASSQQPVSSNQ